LAQGLYSSSTHPFPDALASVFSPEGDTSLPVCISHRTRAQPHPLFFPDASASAFSPQGDTSLPIEIIDQNSKYFQLHGKTEKAFFLVRKTFRDRQGEIVLWHPTSNFFITLFSAPRSERPCLEMMELGSLYGTTWRVLCTIFKPMHFVLEVTTITPTFSCEYRQSRQ
jgi:hypothetical protein